jgi:hypothetical protein
LNAASIILGVLGLVFMCAGMFPLLGWIGWFAVALSTIGAIVGAMGRGQAGLILNMIVVFISFFRLSLGGGVF